VVDLVAAAAAVSANVDQRKTLHCKRRGPSGATSF
jgi:hypothetical protein